ncbi:MAG TPA: acetolactate synthase large subunit [Candidatus Saccharimonadia bacterium]|nr:acetolactate synthase large subunit [Candidatus Saccharimonadia bacterium]
MKAADLFIKSLESAGITHIFGVPGEENLAMVESIRNSNIKLVVTRDEQAATFMAATFGRLTGRTGVAMSTLGPGATNLVTGVAYAQLGAMPLLVITGQKPIKKRKQGMFQIVDVCSMMRPITKLTETIVGADRVPTLVHHALRIAEGERPGAVHLELPEDIAEEESDMEIPAWQVPHRPVASPEAIKELVKAIEQAKSPVLILGAGANRKDMREELHAFIERTGIPFITTQLGKGSADERLETFLGTAAFSDNDFVHRGLAQSDLVLAVGYDYIEKPPAFAAAERRFVNINFYPAGIDEVWRPDYEVVGDIAATLRSVTARVDPQEWDFKYVPRLRKLMLEDTADQSTSGANPVKPQRLVRDLRAVLTDDAVVSLDNGMHKLWFARNYPAYQPNTLLLDNALATMGAGLPGAIAAKMLRPTRQVVAVVGDGGFMMNLADLETAQRLKLDLVVIILNDSGYGMIKWKQAGMNLPDFGLDFTNPDFVKLAESFGATGHRIQHTDGLKATIKQALGTGGIHIIDVPIDYSENQKLDAPALKARTQSRIITV